MKISIINQHTNNLGDEAACLALLDLIEEKDENAIVNILYKTDDFFDSKYKNINNLKMCRMHTKDIMIEYIKKKILHKKNIRDELNEYLNIINSSDSVIVSPCGQNIGIYKDWYFLITILIVVLEKKRPIFHLNSIGKSGNIIFDSIAKYVLKRSDVFVREEYCYNLLTSLGIKCVRGTDTVFSLKEMKYNEKEIYEAKSYLTLIPTRVKSWHPEQKELSEEKILSDIVQGVSNIIKKENLNVVILPHLLGNEEEYKLFAKIKQMLIESDITEEKIYIASEVNTVNQYDQIIKNSRLVVSMRYHGDIFSIKNKVPFLSLAYENKMNEACLYSKMLKYNIELKNVDKNKVINILNEIIKDEKKIIATLNDVNPELSELSRLPIEFLYTNNKK